MRVNNHHSVLGAPIQPPYPECSEQAIFGMGCFWGVERLFWTVSGIITTAVGYAGGVTPNPTYEEVCTGRTGHNEVVLVVFDPLSLSYTELLKIFWEQHDPTQGMRQGNDRGTQYRSGVYFRTEMQRDLATATRAHYQVSLFKAGHGQITTEIETAAQFYFAEDYHQQYLHKNPMGYCGIGGTGVEMDIDAQSLEDVTK